MEYENIYIYIYIYIKEVELIDNRIRLKIFIEGHEHRIDFVLYLFNHFFPVEKSTHFYLTKIILQIFICLYRPSFLVIPLFVIPYLYSIDGYKFFCFLANTGVFMCRSPYENIPSESVPFSKTVLSCLSRLT